MTTAPNRKGKQQVRVPIGLWQDREDLTASGKSALL